MNFEDLKRLAEEIEHDEFLWEKSIDVSFICKNIKEVEAAIQKLEKLGYTCDRHGNRVFIEKERR